MNTTNLEKRTNVYGHTELKCPVCGKWKYTSMGSHIAKTRDGAHAKYWIAHTKKVIKRIWNE